MNNIFISFVFLVVSFLLREKRNNSYKNIHVAITSIILSFCCLIASAIVGLLGVPSSFNPVLFTVIAACLTIICKIIVKQTAKSDGYLPSYRYINGHLAKIIDYFYEKQRVNLYLKPKFVFLRNMLFAAVAVELVFFTIFLFVNNTLPVTLLPCICPLLFAFFETGLFLCGETKTAEEEKKYKLLKNYKTPSKALSARYEYPDDYEYIFRKNNKKEKTHLLHSTIHNYKIPKEESESIRLYDFEEKKYTLFTDFVQNDILERFLKSNGLDINQLFVQVFSLLDSGNNVLMESSSYSDFDPYLAALIKKFSAETYKTIVVVDSETSGNSFLHRFDKVFNEYFGTDPIPVIKQFKDVVKSETEKELVNGKSKTEFKKRLDELSSQSSESDIGYNEIKADIIVLTPEDVIDSQNSEILRSISEDISFIIYYDFSECVHEETLFCKIIHSVLDADDKISTLYMSDGFFDFKQAINNFFSTRPFYEVIVPRKVPKKSYCSVWKYENAREFQERSIINPTIDFGMHPVLATIADQTLHNNSMIIADESDIYHETFSKYTSTTKNTDKIDCFVGWKDIIDGKYVYCSVTDRYNNIPHTYLAMRGIGIEKEYINIISKPYLLREYLAYFSKFFSTVPDALTSFSAAMINTPRATALECLVKCYLIGCTREQLKNYAIKINADRSLEPETLLKRILAEVKFGCSENNLVVTEKNKRFYIDKETYDFIIDKTEFVNKVRFVVNNQEIVRYKKDFNYLVPRQKLALEGRKYTVLNINDSSIELSDSLAREAVYSTRLVRSAHATHTDIKDTFYYASNNNRASMQMSNIICDLDVTIHGRLAFKDDYSFDESRIMNNYIYTAGSKETVRKYTHANVLRVKLKFPGDISSGNRELMAHTLALLMNEMLPTFFPKHSERIMVSCTGWDSPVPEDTNEINLDHIVSSFRIDLDEDCEDDEFCIYMFEDSYIETGVVNVFWQDEELKYMFNILEDYLYYLENIDRETRIHIFGQDTNKPLHDLRKSLLHLLDHPMENSIAEYANSIRRTRDTFFEKRLNNTFYSICDYCGKPIPEDVSRTNYKFYHYSGKRSCLECAKTAVNTENLDAIDKSEEKVKTWMSAKYATCPSGPNLCIVEDAEFLNKVVKPHEYYAVTDDYDAGVAGYTVMNDVGVQVELDIDEELMLRVKSGHSGPNIQEYSDDCEDWIRLGYFVENANIIAIENGLPRYKFEQVMAHELTHQWQYENLDFKLVYQEPFPEVVKDEFDTVIDMTDFRIEGHSSWVEWKYLKTHGKSREAAKLKRQLKNRNDEYGIGFRWFCDLIKVGGTDKYSNIPRDFKFKFKRFIYQLKKNPYALMALYYGKHTAESSGTDKDKEATETTDSNPNGSYDNNNTPDINNAPIEDTPVDDTPSAEDNFWDALNDVPDSTGEDPLPDPPNDDNNTDLLSIDFDEYTDGSDVDSE